MFETVYHGVPIVTIPIFCDHDANAAKAEVDGYAKKLDLQHLTSEELYNAIKEVITDSKYKRDVKYRQSLLKDQKESPLERGVYWTEYVIRHKGAYHLQSPSKDMTFFQYYLLDVTLIFITSLLLISVLISYTLRYGFKVLVDLLQNRRMKKLFHNTNDFIPKSVSKSLINQSNIATKKNS